MIRGRYFIWIVIFWALLFCTRTAAVAPRLVPARRPLFPGSLLGGRVGHPQRIGIRSREVGLRPTGCIRHLSLQVAGALARDVRLGESNTPGRLQGDAPPLACCCGPLAASGTLRPNDRLSIHHGHQDESTTSKLLVEISKPVLMTYSTSTVGGASPLGRNTCSGSGTIILPMSKSSAK